MTAIFHKVVRLQEIMQTAFRTVCDTRLGLSKHGLTSSSPYSSFLRRIHLDVKQGEAEGLWGLE